MIEKVSGGSIPIPGFGSSDCRSGCEAHLIYTGERRGLIKVVEAYRVLGLTPKTLEVKSILPIDKDQKSSQI